MVFRERLWVKKKLGFLKGKLFLKPAVPGNFLGDLWLFGLHRFYECRRLRKQVRFGLTF